MREGRWDQPRALPLLIELNKDSLFTGSTGSPLVHPVVSGLLLVPLVALGKKVPLVVLGTSQHPPVEREKKEREREDSTQTKNNKVGREDNEQPRLL